MIANQFAVEGTFVSGEEIQSGHFMHVQTPDLVAEKAKAWIDGHPAARM